jgi:hypothetical protein
VSAVAVTATVWAVLLAASWGRESDILCVSVDDTLRSLVGLLVLSLALARPAALTAQSLEGSPVACKGQIISRIEVHTRPPFEMTGSKVQQRLARRVLQFHATTNPEIIRRFLALKPGERCTELRRSESERILRAQPYLADASVQSLADENGTVSISVRTVDEVSLVLGGGGAGKPPYLRGFRLGEANLMGEAMSVVGDWRHSAEFHDALSLRLADYQMFSRPYQLHLDFARRERGQNWGVEASHPFLTDLQNVSWRTTVGSRDGYRRFRRIDGTLLLLPFARSYGDVGGVVRIGRPGRIALIGASLSSEHDMPGAVPLIMDLERRLGPATDTVLSGRYDSHSATRINALFGVRDVSFTQVTGFESLDGLQDMRKGVEIASLIGKGVQAFDGGEHDMIVSTDAYAGFGAPRAFGAIEVLAEGRKLDNGDEWDGLLASGRAAVYFKPHVRQTIVASAEWGAGWRQRTPFQLALAEPGGGPLGYRHSWLAGGRRLVTRLEERIFLGQLKQFVSIGVAPFVNTGELWAGDAPFGSNTGVKVSTGISLLGSVPPGSQRLWRLDLALPLHPDYGAKRWELRLTSQNFTRMFWKEPDDIGRNRERAIPTSIFNWP